MTDSKADSVMDAQTVSAQGFICRVCQKLLCSGSVDRGSLRWKSFDAEQTFEVFKRAVKSGCYICLTVWSDAGQYQYPWLSLPKLWEPLRYEVYKHNNDRAVMRWLGVSRETRRGSDSTHLSAFNLKPQRKHERWAFGALQSVVQPEETLKTANAWLEHCLLMHEHCNVQRSEAAKRLPTRLIDVGKGGDTNWKVCVTSEDGVSPLAEYLTLSYRWGPNSGVLLLSSNLTSLRNGRPLDELPLLFQDVIRTAKYLEIRYVWIDALCIVQDSVTDWEAEAPTMCHIYSNGRCNIAAIASASPQEGLFNGTRDLKAIVPGMLDLGPKNGNLRYYVQDSGDWERQVSESHLQDRGWVFQELWSSSRIFYFAKNQLLFKCHTQQRNEVIPEPQDLSQWHNHRPSDPRLFKGDGGCVPNILCWNDLISKYSQCNLTKTTDKLAAVAGIAKVFQDHIEGTYVAGLWTNELIYMMTWKVKTPQQHRPVEYRAPSWSWASVDGAIQTAYMPIEVSNIVEVVEVKVTTRTADPMSTVLKGFARLRGPLIPITFPNASDDRNPVVETGVETITMKIHPDVLDGSIAAGANLFLAPLLSLFERGPWYEFLGLVLDVLPQAPNRRAEYRRVGRFGFQRPKPVDWSKYRLETFDIV